jgi:hypothetical protein
VATFFYKNRIKSYLLSEFYGMSKHLIFFFAPPAAALSAVFLSCSLLFPPVESVTFTLPEWPPENNAGWPPLSGWDIRYCSGKNTGSFTLTAEGDTAQSFTLELAESALCAVTAQPVTRHTGTDSAFFHAAGCLYPEDSSITWENGFPAAVCMQLYSAAECSTQKTAEYLADFNWQKLTDVLKEKAAGKDGCFDPWKLDKDAVCSAVASHRFRASLLSMKNCITVKTARLAAEASKRTETGEAAVLLFLPQYIPSYSRQKDSGLTVVKAGIINSYLYTTKEIAVITCTSERDITLEISAVPLYTGMQ